MNIYIPYTYLIGWSNHNKFYYGRRTAKGCNPKEFWETYHTSSIHVKEFRKEFGEPDIIQIRKTFPNNPDACKLWESKVLERIDAQHNPLFLNKKNGDRKWDSTGLSWTQETRSKRINTVFRKYAALNPFQSEKCKGKRKLTWEEKYNTYHPIISDICKQKNLEKYGTEFTLQSKEIREKGDITKQKKYGDKNFNNREKAKNTNTLRFGVSHPGKRMVICKFCGELKNINHQAKCKLNENRIIPALMNKK